MGISGMKKYFAACILVFPAVCVFYFLMLPGTMLNMTNYFSFGVIAAGFLACVGQKDLLGLLKTGKRNCYLWAAVCTVIFLIMLPMEDLLKSPLLSFDQFYDGTNVLMDYLHAGLALDRGLARGIYALSMAGYLGGLAGYAFLLLLCYFLREPDTRSLGADTEEKIKCIGNTRICVYMVPIILFTAVYMISAVPVMAMPDYTSTLNDISYGIWRLWKPLAWQYFIWFFSNYGSAYFIVIIQAVFWIWVNNYAVGVIWKKASKKGCILYVVWSILVTYPYMQLMSPYDNSIFSTAFLGLVIVTFDIVWKGARSKKDNLIWIFLCTLVLLFRGEGLYVVIAIVILQLLYEYRKNIFRKKLWAFNLGVLMSMYVIVNITVPAFSGMEKSELEYWLYALPLNNLAGIASYGLQIDEEDIAVLEQIMPFDEWKSEYMPENSDNVSKPWGAVGNRIDKFSELHLGPKILTMNLKYFLRYPLYYLKIHGDVINVIWKISPESYNEWSTVYVRDPVMPVNYAFLETGAARISKNLSDFAYTMPIVHSFTNRGAVYLFLVVILMVKLCLDHRRDLLLLCLVILTIPAVLFFSCVVPDTRYVLPLMESSVFLLSAENFIKKKGEYETS